MGLTPEGLRTVVFYRTFLTRRGHPASLSRNPPALTIHLAWSEARLVRNTLSIRSDLENRIRLPAVGAARCLGPKGSMCGSTIFRTKTPRTSPLRGASHRSPAARSYFYVRGNVLIGLLTLPAPLTPVSPAFALFSAQRAMASDLKSVIRGFWHGLRDGFWLLHRNRGRRMALDSYLRWRRLPWPPNC